MSWLKAHQHHLQIVVSFLCLGFAVALVDPGALLELLKDARMVPLLLVVALMPAEVLIRAWRWRYLLACKGVEVRPGAITRLTFIGRGLNLFLPASLGDVVRSYYGWREVGHKEAMLASSLSDKVVALFTLCVLGAVCALYVGMVELAAVAFALAVPTGLVLFVPQLLPWHWADSVTTRLLKKSLDVERLRDAFRMDLRMVLLTVAMSLIGWIVTNLIYYYAAETFSLGVSVWYMFAVAPLINVVRTLPISVSGLGSADLLIVFLLAAVGVTEAGAMAASMLVNVILIILPGLIGALFIMQHSRMIKRAPAAVRQSAVRTAQPVCEAP